MRGGLTRSCGCLSESMVAFELKQYFSINYDGISEYKVVKNPRTGYFLPYDIYLPNENIFIEINGEQHYEHRTTGKFEETLKEFNHRKKLDKIKKDYVTKNGIFIAIDLRKIKSTAESLKYIFEKMGGRKNESVIFNT